MFRECLLFTANTYSYLTRIYDFFSLIKRCSQTLWLLTRNVKCPYLIHPSCRYFIGTQTILMCAHKESNTCELFKHIYIYIYLTLSRIRMHHMYVFLDYDLLLSGIILATFHFRVLTNSIDICLLFVYRMNSIRFFLESSYIEM